MLKAVICDLDDTLYEYKELNEKAMKALRDYTCNRLSISESSFYRAYNWARDETKRILGNTGASHNRMLYCQKMLEHISVPSTVVALEMYEVYWGYMLRHMCLRDGVRELLNYCRKCGIKVGICTDLTAHIQHRKIRHLGIDALVDAIVTSEEAGAEKPEPIIYEMILRKLDVTAEEAVFVGDDWKKDIEGAQAAGIRAIWYNPKTDFYKITKEIVNG